MSMTLEQLQSFCSKDASRPHLQTPFVLGSAHPDTFATDGIILVRVEGQRLTEHELNHDETQTAILALRWDGPLALPLEPLPATIPLTPMQECDECAGAGCDECDGVGKWESPIGMNIGNKRLSEFYLAKLATLPNCRIAASYGEPLDPMPFAFDGGCGYLMPMRAVKAAKE